MGVPWQTGEVLGPEGAVSASDLQHVHILCDTALFVDPGKPSLRVARIIPVQTDPGGDIGGILVLKLETFFHAGQMDQVQHMAPVDLMLVFDGTDRVFDGTFHQLHLFDPVLDKLLLKV